MKKIAKFSGYAAVICYVVSIAVYLSGLDFPVAGWVAAGLALTAVAFNGNKNLKGFSYSGWIVFAILLGMCFPQHLDKIGNFELKRLIVPFVQVTMLGMGAQMSFNDFKTVIKMPKGVFTGLICHFTIMPFVGFGLSKLFHFSPEIAGGVVLIGCVPSAMASNVMSFLAKANLALAVTIGAIGTMAAPFLTPLLMQWLGGQYVEINVVGMMVEITNMVIVPIVAGFIFNLFYQNITSKNSKIIQLVSYATIIIVTNLGMHFGTDAAISSTLWKCARSFMLFYFLPMIIALVLRRNQSITREKISSCLGFIAMLGIVINTAIITAAGRDSLIQVGMLLILSCLIHNVVGYSLGYSLATLVRLPEKDRRTIAFEVGMQNGGVATGIALEMGKIATVGLASAIFGPLQNLTGSALVNIFKKIPIKEKSVIS